MNVNGKSVIYKGLDNMWWIGEEVDDNEIMYSHPVHDVHGRFPPVSGRASHLNI
jgi:hypothetical protein